MPIRRAESSIGFARNCSLNSRLVCVCTEVFSPPWLMSISGWHEFIHEPRWRHCQEETCFWSKAPVYAPRDRAQRAHAGIRQVRTNPSRSSKQPSITWFVLQGIQLWNELSPMYECSLTNLLQMGYGYRYRRFCNRTEAQDQIPRKVWALFQRCWHFISHCLTRP